VSSFLDASHVYGLSDDTARALREMKGGLLRANTKLRSKGLMDLLPPKTEDPDQNCVRDNKNEFCFLAGKILNCLIIKIYGLYKTISLFR